MTRPRTDEESSPGPPILKLVSLPGARRGHSTSMPLLEILRRCRCCPHQGAARSTATANPTETSATPSFGMRWTTELNRGSRQSVRLLFSSSSSTSSARAAAIFRVCFKCHLFDSCDHGAEVVPWATAPPPWPKAEQPFEKMPFNRVSVAGGSATGGMVRTGR